MADVDYMQKLISQLADNEDANDQDSARLSGVQRDVGQQQSQNALISSLAKSAGQIGSFNGHVADASPVSDMAGQVNQAAKAQYGDLVRSADRDSKRRAMDSKVTEYLAGKQAMQQEGDKNRDSREQMSADRNDQKDRHDDLVNYIKSQGGQGKGSKYIQAGTDPQGNILVMDQTTGQIVNSGAKGQRMATPPRVGPDADAPNPKVDKDFGKLGHDLTSGLASSRSDMGRNQATVTSADKVLTLGEQGKGQEGGLDKRQIHELAISSANLVSNGTGAAQATVDALVPHSSGEMSSRIEEWLSANPTGTGQQAFVSRMLETAEREKHLAAEKINGIKTDVLQSYSYLKDADPDRWDKTVKYHLGTDAQFDPQGRYVPKPYKGKAAGPAPSQGGPGMAVAAPAGSVKPTATLHPEAAAAVTWAQANRLSPDADKAAKAQEILKRTGGP